MLITNSIRIFILEIEVIRFSSAFIKNSVNKITVLCCYYFSSQQT